MSPRNLYPLFPPNTTQTPPYDSYPLIPLSFIISNEILDIGMERDERDETSEAAKIAVVKKVEISTRCGGGRLHISEGGHSPRWRRRTWSATWAAPGTACCDRARRWSSTARFPSGKNGRRAASAAATACSPCFSAPASPLRRGPPLPRRCNTRARSQLYTLTCGKCTALRGGNDLALLVFARATHGWLLPRFALASYSSLVRSLDSLDDAERR